MRSQNSFLQFSLKIQLFLKKLLNKKIFSIKFLIKKAIFIFGKVTPDRSHSDPVGHVANKVRVEGTEAPFNPYFHGLKYRSSDALPAPEIFLIVPIRGRFLTLPIKIELKLKYGSKKAD